MKRRACLFVCLLFAAVALVSCGDVDRSADRGGRLKVVTTLFPLYDFARNVGGEKAEVLLLLPPGVEAHSFDPKPRDILTVNGADLFVYTGSFMEPWAADLIKGVKSRKLVVVDSSTGITLLREADEEGVEGQRHAGSNGVHEHGPIDPHIWLDLGDAQIMVENILKGFVGRDPANRAFYEKNAAEYKTRLQKLDRDFRDGLSSCEKRVFVHGGHYAFSYLARRYNLTYVSVYGFSPNSEPSAHHLADIIDTMKKNQVRCIFYEELIRPRVAETIAEETGAKLLPLNGGHNVTKDQLKKGVSFISILEKDLQSFREGLQCR
jgi:zinc transport system substrate-binding protein